MRGVRTLVVLCCLIAAAVGMVVLVRLQGGAGPTAVASRSAEIAAGPQGALDVHGSSGASGRDARATSSPVPGETPEAGQAPAAPGASATVTGSQASASGSAAVASAAPLPTAGAQSAISPVPATATPAVAAPARVTASPIPGTPLPQPAAVATPPVLPADAPPRIVALGMSAHVVHPGEVVSGYAITSSNVAAVTLRLQTITTPMQKVGVGRFAISYVVPQIPFFLKGNYTIEVIASNARGDTVERDVPITVR